MIPAEANPLRLRVCVHIVMNKLPRQIEQFLNDYNLEM